MAVCHLQWAASGQDVGAWGDSAQPVVGGAKQHKQNVYLTAKFGHHIGRYLNN